MPIGRAVQRAMHPAIPATVAAEPETSRYALRETLKLKESKRPSVNAGADKLALLGTRGEPRLQQATQPRRPRRPKEHTELGTEWRLPRE